MKKILLIDDEKDILEFLGYNLSREGFDVSKCTSGTEGIKLAQTVVPDLIILDVMMPGLDGVETCQRLRELPQLDQTLIIFLTARGEDFTQIAALDAGGDDFITKPIKPRVLVSRINAHLRRNTQEKNGDDRGAEVVGDVVLDRDQYAVVTPDQKYDLPKKEFELLSLLMSKPGHVFTRSTILQTVWGDDVFINDRTIDVHIRKLRKKIGDENIRTVKGIGYKFDS